MAGRFDQLAPFFREVFGGRTHHGLWRYPDDSLEDALREMEDFVIGRLAVSSGERVLDVGCGSGGIARRLASMHGARVTGWDSSPAQIGQAGANDNAVFRCGDWMDNDLADGSFDAALAIESLEHMTDPVAALREIARVLAPGGRLLIGSWTANRMDRRLESIRRAGGLPGLLGTDEFLHALRGAGFQIENVVDLSERVARTWTACLGRTLRVLPGSGALLRAVAGSPVLHGSMALAALRIRLAYQSGLLGYRSILARKPAV